MADANRVTRVCDEVKSLVAVGMSLERALAMVQRIEHRAAIAEGLDYGPSLTVARVWELAGERV